MRSFLGIGCFFVIVTAIGIVRFPDLFSRLHPAGKTDTVGQALIFIGLMIYEGFSLISVQAPDHNGIYLYRKPNSNTCCCTGCIFKRGYTLEEKGEEVMVYWSNPKPKAENISMTYPWYYKND
jgi:hypothetical protein